MKISFLLTPRLMVILSACAVSIVLLLLMLGFELGLRQAHEDYLAQAKAHGEPLSDSSAYTAKKFTGSTNANSTNSSNIAPGSANQMKQETP